MIYGRVKQPTKVFAKNGRRACQTMKCKNVHKEEI